MYRSTKTPTGDVEVWLKKNGREEYVGSWQASRSGWGDYARFNIPEDKRLRIEALHGLGGEAKKNPIFVGHHWVHLPRSPEKLKPNQVRWFNDQVYTLELDGDGVVISGNGSRGRFSRRQLEQASVSANRARGSFVAVLSWFNEATRPIKDDEVRSKLTGLVGRIERSEFGGVRVRWPNGSVGHYTPGKPHEWCEENVARLDAFIARDQVVQAQELIARSIINVVRDEGPVPVPLFHEGYKARFTLDVDLTSAQVAALRAAEGKRMKLVIAVGEA